MCFGFRSGYGAVLSSLIATVTILQLPAACAGERLRDKIKTEICITRVTKNVAVIDASKEIKPPFAPIFHGVDLIAAKFSIGEYLHWKLLASAENQINLGEEIGGIETAKMNVGWEVRIENSRGTIGMEFKRGGLPAVMDFEGDKGFGDRIRWANVLGRDGEVCPELFYFGVTSDPSLIVAHAGIGENHGDTNHSSRQSEPFKGIVLVFLGMASAFWGVCHIFFKAPRNGLRAFIPGVAMILIGWAIGSLGGFLVLLQVF